LDFALVWYAIKVQRPRRAINILGNRLETGRIVLYSLSVGVCVGLVGIVFAWLLELAQGVLLSGVTGFRPPGLPSEGGVLQSFAGDRAWLLPVVLVIGLVLVSFARRNPTLNQIEPDGLDNALDIYHNREARGSWQKLLLETVSGFLASASGAPLGREGPFSSLASLLSLGFSKFGRVSDADRRLIFISSLAAVLGLVLRAPLAASVLAVEILYRRFEFEIEALTPAVLASVVAFTIFGVARGFDPLFGTNVVGGQPASSFPAFFALGLLEALAAAGFVAALIGLRAAWDRTKLPSWTRLLIAALIFGGVAYFNPNLLGDGLGWTQLGLNGFMTLEDTTVQFILRSLLVLFVASAGASGGLVIPSLVIGGLLANMYSLGLSKLIPGITVDPAAFTLTGMAAFLAGTMNAPLAATLLVTEWSGYGLLAPLLLTTLAGYALTGRESVLKHQAESRSSSPVHINEYLRAATGLSSTQLTASSVPNVIESPANVRPILPDLLDLLSSSSLSVSDEDDERLYKFPVPQPWVGQAVRDLEWQPEALLVAILRDGHIRVPKGISVLEANDELVLLSDPETYGRLTSKPGDRTLEASPEQISQKRGRFDWRTWFAKPFKRPTRDNTSQDKS
jgi:chloride channel protein, CIC family